MSDTELIEKVAKLKGWEEGYAHDSKTWFWCDSGDGVYSKTELPSTDACLALLDMEKGFDFYWHTVDKEFRIQYGDSEKYATTFADVPRAILLALLEVK